MYGATDSFEEKFEIHSLNSPHTAVRSFAVADLCDLAGMPRLATSTGPDGLTSVTARDGWFYVIAVSPSSADAIFKVSADGATVRLFAQLEMFDRGDSFNYSEMAPGLSADQFFLAETNGLLELNGSGAVLRTIDASDFNGAALVGNSLFAVTAGGSLRGDLDVTDDSAAPDETPWTTFVELNEPVADLQYGSFGSIGHGLFVLATDGDVGYWTSDALASGNPGQPKWLFNVAPAFKIALTGGDMFAALGEDAERISESVQSFEIEAVESQVSITEGREATATIRLHGAAPPAAPVIVTITRAGGDPDISVETATVTFDANNWRADAYVKLRAASDADAANGTATIVASAPGIADATIDATELDKDGPLAIALHQSAIDVREGRTGVFQVSLTADPKTPVTVTTTWASGDASVQVQDHGAVQFNSSNWDQPQWVALVAGMDTDFIDGTAILTVSATGMTSRQMTVHVKDAGPPGTPVSYDSLVDDYQPLPLQGETQFFEFYDRLGGDRGETYSAGSGIVAFGRGCVEAHVTAAGGFAGVWHSLNHSVAEGIPLNLAALLPEPIKAEYQYHATAIWVDIEDGSGQFKLELKDPANVLLWSHIETLSGEAQRLFVRLSNPPTNAQLLNWIVQGGAGSFVKVARIGIEVQGPAIGNLETFLWPYSWLLGNFDATTGFTRDRAEFPAGDFDAVNASGAQAALAAVAERLGVISTADAQQIVTKTHDALLQLQSGDSVHDVLPHFVKQNFVLDNPFIASGVWVSDTSLPGYHGPDCLQSDPATGAGQVHWDLTISRPGEYEVFARWTAANTHAPDAPYEIHYEGGQAAVTVDQRSRGGEWVSLGKYNFAKGSYSVTLSNQATGTVIADALRLEGPPQIVPNTEYSTIDTLIGLGGVLLASQSLGLPTTDIEQAIRNIDWTALTLPDGTISHGYTETGGLLPTGWDTFGGESLLVALFCAASTGEIPTIKVNPADPHTYNGSGFIDELPWLFVDSIATDAWGVNWLAYRHAAADRQVAYFDRYSVPAFGLSAGEPPIPSQFSVAAGQNVAIPYVAYGVGGDISANDGSDMFNQPVVTPHYSGMVASLDDAASGRMWDWMQNAGLVSPLNSVESLVVQQWGTNLETHFHALKGSWNIALEALGAGRALLANNYPLHAASQDNAFVAAGLNTITMPSRPATCGVYDPVESKFYLKFTNSEGFANLEFGFGAPGWKPLAGDWDGDGRDTIGLFQPEAAHFYLRNSNSSGLADVHFGYGDPAQNAQYVLVMGDWNGDGVDTIGLYHKASATWFLRNTNSEGVADVTVGFGAPGSEWTPMVGDWNADGVDTIGLYDPATGMFYLRNSQTTGIADIAFPYGSIGSGWTPLIGDWDGNGEESAGFYQPGAASHFYLRNQFTAGLADVHFGLAFAGVLPIVGDWIGPTGQALRAVGSGQMAVGSMQGGAGRAAGDEGLLAPSPQSLAPLLSAAIARWAEAGVTLAAPQVIVTDLPGAEVGRAQDGAVYIDVDAAGHGWFIDPTPALDEEFSSSGAAVDPRAVDRIDLLTVIEHELGHVAGLNDLASAETSLMSDAIATGVRRTVSAVEIDAIFAE